MCYGYPDGVDSPHAFQINAAFTLTQDHLLEAGWNKSETTQMDVEKTLNCCGFSNVNYTSCAAVSKPFIFFFSFSAAARS